MECLSYFQTTIGEEIRQFVMRLGDGRYACKLCDQSFKQGNNLYRHIRSLHLMKKHHCPECGKEFPRKDSLKDHLKTTHGLSMAAYYASAQGREEAAAALADEAICSSTTPSSLLGCGEFDSSNMASLDSSDLLQYWAAVVFWPRLWRTTTTTTKWLKIALYTCYCCWCCVVEIRLPQCSFVRSSHSFFYFKYLLFFIPYAYIEQIGETWGLGDPFGPFY